MRTDIINLKIKKVIGKRTKNILIKILFPWRNNFKLFNISDKAKKGKVNLNYWDESLNLGDTLSPIIVNHLLSLKGVEPDCCISTTKHLYAVGSVLTAGIQDATVWGSGVLNATLLNRLEGRELDIRLVRGPLTRICLQDYGYQVPEVYGDPALLMPEIYMPQNIKKRAKFGIILHKDYDKSVLQSKSLKNVDFIILDICTNNYKKFIDDIVSVDIVISSSLHGIILAEAYDIKAILLKPHIDLIKYYDYYYSTKRYQFPIPKTIEEAINTVPVALPDLVEIRERIKNVFPYDIYK